VGGDPSGGTSASAPQQTPALGLTWKGIAPRWVLAGVSPDLGGH